MYLLFACPWVEWTLQSLYSSSKSRTFGLKIKRLRRFRTQFQTQSEPKKALFDNPSIFIHSLTIFKERYWKGVRSCEPEVQENRSTVNWADWGVSYKLQKKCMIFFSNALANPRTMVIQPFDAFLTAFAVVRSWFFYLLAFKAPGQFIDHWHVLLVYLFIKGQSSMRLARSFFSFQ